MSRYLKTEDIAKVARLHFIESLPPRRTTVLEVSDADFEVTPMSPGRAKFAMRLEIGCNIVCARNDTNENIAKKAAALLHYEMNSPALRVLEDLQQTMFSEALDDTESFKLLGAEIEKLRVR